MKAEGIMEEELQIRKKFRRLERDVLILIAIPLPVFAFTYLHHTSGNLYYNIPDFPELLEHIGIFLVFALLIFQYVNFSQKIRPVRTREENLTWKMEAYASATIVRFWFLFWISFLCAAGLFIYANTGFIIAYVITLVFISTGKPTPDRIINSLHLKGEERKKIYAINKRED